eukprot:jgi/Ulvmu1/10149/UM006_0103.1
MLSKALLAGTALLAALGSASAGDSVASCKIKGGASASSQSASVVSSVTASIDAFLCPTTLYPNPATVQEAAGDVATAVATAFASAIAEVTLDCYATGNTRIKVNGQSFARAQASAFSAAIALGYGTAKTCHKCEVAAELVVESISEIFLDATADAEVAFDGVTNGDTISVAQSSFVSVFLSETVEATAAILVDAVAAVDECGVAITGEAVTGSNNFPSSAFCFVDITATDGSKFKNAVAELGADIAVEACDNDVYSSIDATVEAVATATANAIIAVTADCEVIGKGTACTVGSGNITATAKAVASAFAFGWVSATSTCHPPLCSVSTDFFADAVGEVLAEAANAAVFDQCTQGDNDFFSTSILSEVIVEESKKALASLILSASVSKDGKCDLTVDFVVSTNPTPTPPPTPPTPPPPAPTPPPPPPPPPPVVPKKPPPPPPVVPKPPPPPPAVPPPAPPPAVPPVHPVVTPPPKKAPAPVPKSPPKGKGKKSKQNSPPKKKKSKGKGKKRVTKKKTTRKTKGGKKKKVVTKKTVVRRGKGGKKTVVKKRTVKKVTPRNKVTKKTTKKRTTSKPVRTFSRGKAVARVSV